MVQTMDAIMFRSPLLIIVLFFVFSFASFFFHMPTGLLPNKKAAVSLLMRTLPIPNIGGAGTMLQRIAVPRLQFTWEIP